MMTSHDFRKVYTALYLVIWYICTTCGNPVGNVIPAQCVVEGGHDVWRTPMQTGRVGGHLSAGHSRRRGERSSPELRVVLGGDEEPLPHLGGVLHPHTVQPARAKTRYWKGDQRTLGVVRIQEGGAPQHRCRVIRANISKKILQSDDDTINKLIAFRESEMKGVVGDVTDGDVFR